MEIQKDIIHFEFSADRDAHRDLCSVRCLCLPQGGKPTRPPYQGAPSHCSVGSEHLQTSKQGRWARLEAGTANEPTLDTKLQFIKAEGPNKPGGEDWGAMTPLSALGLETETEAQRMLRMPRVEGLSGSLSEDVSR